ncbi:RNA-directed DNA polymerase [Anaerostipes caccae]|uniref:RNA-directed DNA polymerase n=1 Tax=Anaerostipes caccae TaxID=105841 RepID=UPI0038D43EC6
MKLEKQSVEWAVKHVEKQRDTDLFPQLKEYIILFRNKELLINEISEIDIGSYVWQPYRRFIIPKDEYSYRVAIQLDPIDNLLFVALTYQIGNKIEARRISIEENKVFNYRFNPNEEGELYDKKDVWKKFWNTSAEKAKNYGYAVYIDIADFYNRIYHHTLENQLIDCEIENQLIKAIKNLLQNTTQTTSQGIPIGPHASHLYAELCLIPLDNNLTYKGYDFCRYSDDIIVFAETEMDAHIVIFEMAKMLDSLKLNMQRHKTKIYVKEDFITYCNNMKNDNPINELENEMIKTLEKYSSDPYASIDFSSVEEIDKNVFSKEKIEKILNEYLDDSPDFQRIRWLFRRLSKIGVDTAIDLVLLRFNDLIPALNDIALYFASVADNSDDVLKETGENIIALLNNKLVKSNEFFQLTLTSLFANTHKFNNISVLLGMFNYSSDSIKREIILAAYKANMSSWIRDTKQEYYNLGLWGQRAILMASELLPKDERKFFIQSVRASQMNKTADIISQVLLKHI